MQAVPRTIGVLGGMGPQATVHFMNRLIALVDAEDDRDHVPLLVDSNTQVPSRIKALIEGGGDDPGRTLAQMARRLEAAGAEALVMPCNTAHHYAPQIRNASSLPFISMVERTCERLAEAYPHGRIGLLASPAVIGTGVYDAPLRAYGLNVVLPGDQDGLLHSIRALKRSSNDQPAIGVLNRAAADIAAQGADVAILACSEFSLVAGQITAPIETWDSIDVLAEETVAFALTGADAPAAQRRCA